MNDEKGFRAPKATPYLLPAVDEALRRTARSRIEPLPGPRRAMPHQRRRARRRAALRRWLRALIDHGSR